MALPRHKFPSTHWSAVARAGDVDSAVRRPALVWLIERYHRPLREHLVGRKGLRPHDADDLLQQFVASRVLEDGLLGHARQGRGRFRNFLLAALDMFEANSRREARALKRAPEAAVSLESLPQMSGAIPEPDEAFEAAWAREVLRESLRRMREQCHCGGRNDIWLVFEGRVLAGTVAGGEPIAYETLAEKVRLDTAQVRNLLVTAKRSFARTLREVVSEYEGAEADVEAEIADLAAALSKGGTAGSAVIAVGKA